MSYKSMCVFFMRLFASKNFHQSKLALMNKVEYLKKYLLPKKSRVFLKVITRNIYIQNYKAKVDQDFKLELLKVK